MMNEIKVYKFYKATANDIDSFTVVTDYKAFIGDERVGFVRVTAFQTEDMEGRVCTKEVTEEKQIDSEEAKTAIYQSIGR